MPLLCPNCSTPWTGDDTVCHHCGATFISGLAWQWQRNEAVRLGAGRTLAGLCTVAAVFTWLLVASMGLAATLRETGSLGLARDDFVRELGTTQYGLWLACAALVMGMSAALISRLRHVAWAGLLCAAIFMGLRLWL